MGHSSLPFLVLMMTHRHLDLSQRTCLKQKVKTKQNQKEADTGYYTAALMKKYFGLWFFSVNTLNSAASLWWPVTITVHSSGTRSAQEVQIQPLRIKSHRGLELFIFFSCGMNKYIRCLVFNCMMPVFKCRIFIQTSKVTTGQEESTSNIMMSMYSLTNRSLLSLGYCSPLSFPSVNKSKDKNT